MTATATVKTVEQLLQQMVQINTVNTVVSGDPLIENRLGDFNEAVAQSMGFGTKRLPVAGRADNLLVTYEVSGGLPWLMFESHMDTVTVEGMTVDPFAAEIRDGRIWGRGTCDTKGTGAAMLWAMHQYSQSSVQPHNVAILFAIDEESGMRGIRNFITNDYSKLGFEPVGVIVGEPTLLQPIIAHNGCVRWKIITHGIAAHSSTPDLGHSAISDMAAVIAAVERDYIPNLAQSHPQTGKAQCSINMISGGIQVNVIPEQCEVHLDRRVVPGEDESTVLPDVQKVLDSVAKTNPKAKIEQELMFSCPPLPPEPAQKLLPKVQTVLKAMDLSTDPLGKPYATDAGDLGSAGVPTIVIGPGSIEQAHTKDEYLEIEQLHRGVELYLKLMQTA